MMLPVARVGDAAVFSSDAGKIATAWTGGDTASLISGGRGTVALSTLDAPEWLGINAVFFEGDSIVAGTRGSYGGRRWENPESSILPACLIRHGAQGRTLSHGDRFLPKEFCPHIDVDLVASYRGGAFELRGDGVLATISATSPFVQSLQVGGWSAAIEQVVTGNGEDVRRYPVPAVEFTRYSLVNGLPVDGRHDLYGIQAAFDLIKRDKSLQGFQRWSESHATYGIVRAMYVSAPDDTLPCQRETWIFYVLADDSTGMRVSSSRFCGISIQEERPDRKDGVRFSEPLLSIEGLLRWHAATGGTPSPVQFIDIAGGEAAVVSTDGAETYVDIVGARTLGTTWR